MTIEGEAMSRSSRAFIISVALHAILFVMLASFHVKSKVREGKPSIGVLFEVKAPPPKLERPKLRIEPQKFDLMPKETETTYRPVEPRLKIDSQMIVATANKNVSARERTGIPFGLQTPFGSLKTNETFSGGLRAVGTRRYTRNTNRLVEFIDRERGTRSVVYCLDISASMGASNRLNLSRNYLKESLLSLNENDKFNVIAFSKDLEMLSPNEMLKATRENIMIAMDFLDKFTLQSIKANTKTDLLSPILRALDMKPSVVVIVTDGLPTAGVVQPERIIQIVKERNVSGTKIYAIGMEMDEEQPEAWLMKNIAMETNGEYQFF